MEASQAKRWVSLSREISVQTKEANEANPPIFLPTALMLPLSKKTRSKLSKTGAKSSVIPTIKKPLCQEIPGQVAQKQVSILTTSVLVTEVNKEVNLEALERSKL